MGSLDCPGLSHVASQVSKGLCLSHPPKPFMMGSRQLICYFSLHPPRLSKILDHQWSRIQNFSDLGDMIKCIFCSLHNTHIGVWKSIPCTNILVFLPQNLGIFTERRKKKDSKYSHVSFFCQLSLP